MTLSDIHGLLVQEERRRAAVAKMQLMPMVPEEKEEAPPRGEGKAASAASHRGRGGNSVRNPLQHATESKRTPRSRSGTETGVEMSRSPSVSSSAASGAATPTAIAGGGWGSGLLSALTGGGRAQHVDSVTSGPASSEVSEHWRPTARKTGSTRSGHTDA